LRKSYIKYILLGVVTLVGVGITTIIQRFQGIPYDLVGILILGFVWLLIVIAAYVFGEYRSKKATAIGGTTESVSQEENGSSLRTGLLVPTLLIGCVLALLVGFIVGKIAPSSSFHNTVLVEVKDRNL